MELARGDARGHGGEGGLHCLPSQVLIKGKCGGSWL